MKRVGHYAIAATVTSDRRLDHEAAIGPMIAPGMTATPMRPPAFYQNKLGVVTNRRQFQSFYNHELLSGQPLGPHIFARY